MRLGGMEGKPLARSRLRIVLFLSAATACGRPSPPKTCGDGQAQSTTRRSVSGDLTFERVPTSATGLDYGNTERRPVRGAVVDVLSGGALLAPTRFLAFVGDGSRINLTAAGGDHALLVELFDAGAVRATARRQADGTYELRSFLTTAGKAYAVAVSGGGTGSYTMIVSVGLTRS